MEAVTVRAGEEVVCSSLAQIKHQFSYLSHYHDNLANLSSKVDDLECKSVRVQHLVTRAEQNSEVIEDDVTKWLEKVEVTRSETTGILEERKEVGNGCWKGWCLNLKPRYSLSRKAMKKANDLDALLAQGEFMTVSRGQRPLGVVYESTGSEVASYTTASNVLDIASTSAGTSGGFPSRQSTMREIMEALKDDSIRMVRICGMGGVGKTTMAKEVEKRTREDRLFEEIAKAEFTQQVDVRRIQGYLAESVGLKLEEDDPSARAFRLGERLNNQNKKTLLILENVWRREDLESVGIPLDEEKMSCKILLTSRSEDVCADLRIQKIFRIGVLSDQEAQILFQNTVGPASYARMSQIAEDIVKECGGLPLAITSIGRALANKTKVTWNNVLRQLKKSTLQGEYAAVFNSLEVSYDFLEPEEMKDCFLLCSLFPEGFNVPIEDLVRFGLALRLFRKIDNVQDARNQAHTHVEKLVNSNLLLASDLKEHVKMHDLVRDFALSTASKGKYMVRYACGPYGLTEWPMEDEDASQDYTSISLQCEEMHELPNGLDYPKLKLLKLVSDGRLPKFPENFYKGMGELNVLAFSRMFIPLAPSSVQMLTNLRALSINDIMGPCDISTIVNLEKLEVLSLARSCVAQFPRGIGKFNRLRLLDLIDTEIVGGFPPGVLKRLIGLQELYLRLPNYSRFLPSAKEEQATIAEIKFLSKLVVLDINIRHDSLLMDFPFENLERFKISIWSNASEDYAYGRFYRLGLQTHHYTYQFQNTLKLIVDKSVLVQDRFNAMLRETEILDLQVKDLVTFLEESKKGDSSNLKILSLVCCDKLMYLISTKELDRRNVFPNLHTLYLHCLNNLEALYHVEHSKESSSGIKEMELPGSLHPWVGPARLATFGNLEVLDVRDCNKLEYIFSSSIARGLVMLKRLKIVDCEMMRAIFSEDRGDEDETAAAGKIEFPHLKYLELDRLPKLTSLFTEANTWVSDQQANACATSPLFNRKVLHTVGGFQNLRSIVVESCSSLRQLFTPSVAVHFGELQHLQLGGCDSLRAIVGAEGAEGEEEECAVKGILFPQLNDLCLIFLPNLSSIMPKTCTFNWSSLKKLRLEDYGGESDLFANMIGIQKGTSGHKIALTSLEYMKISNMNLNTPATISHSIQGFDHLEELTVKYCDSFEIAFDLEELIVGGEHKVVPLHRLRRLHLLGLRSMTRVWKIGPQGFQGFQNLNSLRIDGCDSIKYSLSPVIAKSLVKLRDIYLFNCGMMEEVISNRDKVEEEDQGNAAADDMIFLPKLEDLLLHDLPSLVCIGPGAFAGCDRLSLGAPGGIGSTETTHHEVIDTTLISSQTSNEELSSSAASGTLEGSSQHQLPAWSLCYPRALCVIHCHKMLHVISSITGAGLQKLDDVTISYCHSVVEIFEVDGMNIDEERALTIPKLTRLNLYSLPKLRYIWRSKFCRVLEFPNLKRVEISNCDSMRYLFCSSTVRSLVHLNEIIIRDCKMMEVIVKEEDEVEVAAKGESDRTIKLVLPRLERIELKNLPNLRGICLGLLDFKLPSLNFMYIKECPDMRIFTNGCLSTPNLEKVSINSSEYSLEGNLNTILKQAQDEKTKSDDVDEDKAEDDEEKDEAQDDE